MRGLSENFMNDLIAGMLKPFLDLVHADDTLCLEIRNEYINIYYRGGSMYKIEKPNNSSEYKISFDQNYLLKPLSGLTDPNPVPNNRKVIDIWISRASELKAAMDVWFRKNQRPEREFQQVILRENNYSAIANDTDYYISDIEYADPSLGARFDMLAVKWISGSAQRKFRKGIRPVYIEMKFGDNALDNNSDLQKHMADILAFLSDNKKRAQSVAEIERQFNQKIELGLISKVSKKICIDRNEKPEFILILANHKPASTKLANELASIMASQTYRDLMGFCDVRVACSSFMGYGLYDSTMISLNKCLKLLASSEESVGDMVESMSVDE